MSEAFVGDSTFGGRLAILRTEKGLGQRALAEAVSSTQASVSSWESGKARPRQDTFLKLANFFDVDIVWLMSGRGRKQRTYRPDRSNESATSQASGEPTGFFDLVVQMTGASNAEEMQMGIDAVALVGRYITSHPEVIGPSSANGFLDRACPAMYRYLQRHPEQAARDIPESTLDIIFSTL